MPITLQIQLISKPEMSFDEMKDYIGNNFPRTNYAAIIPNKQSGIVHVELQQDALTDEQRDWLSTSIFAARYIDEYKIKPTLQTGQSVYERELEPLTSPKAQELKQCEFSHAELILLDLGIIERRDRLAFHREHLHPVALRTDKQAQSIKKLMEADLKRLEELHNKLSSMIEELDIKGE